MRPELASAMVLIIALGASSARAGKKAEAPTAKAAPGSYPGDRAEQADMRSYLTLASENNNEFKAAFHARRDADKAVSMRNQGLTEWKRP